MDKISEERVETVVVTTNPVVGEKEDVRPRRMAMRGATNFIFLFFLFPS